MPCEDYLKMKLVHDAGNVLISSELETNLKAWLDWTYLGIGGWSNIEGPTPGPYGGDYNVLRAATDRAFPATDTANTRVWEGVRKDWVWETGVVYNSESYGYIASGYYDPSNGVHLVLRNSTEVSRLNLSSGDQIVVSNASSSTYNGTYNVIATSGTHIITDENSAPHQGTSIDTGRYYSAKEYSPIVPVVEVDDVLVDDADYYVDYPNGRVVFNTEIPVDSEVRVDHSFRNLQIYVADDVEWYRKLQDGSMRVDDPQFLTQNQGEWSLGPHARIQMPCIIVEAVDRAAVSPREIGGENLKFYQDIVFTIFAETSFEKKQISDMLVLQSEKSIWLFNSNEVERRNSHPLDHRGMLVGTYMYPAMVETDSNDGFRWSKAIWKNCTKAVGRVSTPKLFSSTVRVTFEVIV